jgi:transposase-like protein
LAVQRHLRRYRTGRGGKYPTIVRLWEAAWAEFVPFLQFDVEIRKIICTTDAIASINARIRKAVRTRGLSPPIRPPSSGSTWPS